MDKLITYVKNKLATLEFWWAKHRIKEGRDFEVVRNSYGDEVSLKILRGEYTGVEFKYSVLTVSGGNDAIIDFKTIVTHNPNKLDVTSRKFVRLTTNILRMLLIQAAQDGIENENRKIDITEPDEERGFYEESTPLLERRISTRKSRKKVASGDTAVHSKVQQPTKRKRNKTGTPRKAKSNRKRV